MFLSLTGVLYIYQTFGKNLTWTYFIYYSHEVVDNKLKTSLHKYIQNYITPEYKTFIFTKVFKCLSFTKLSYCIGITLKIASEMYVPHSLGKPVFNIMRYRSSDTVERSGDFQSSRSSK